MSKGATFWPTNFLSLKAAPFFQAQSLSQTIKFIRTNWVHTALSIRDRQENLSSSNGALYCPICWPNVGRSLRKACKLKSSIQKESFQRFAWAFQSACSVVSKANLPELSLELAFQRFAIHLTQSHCASEPHSIARQSRLSWRNILDWNFQFETLQKFTTNLFTVESTNLVQRSSRSFNCRLVFWNFV